MCLDTRSGAQANAFGVESRSCLGRWEAVLLAWIIAWVICVKGHEGVCVSRAGASVRVVSGGALIEQQ